MKRRLVDSDGCLSFNAGSASTTHSVTFRNDSQLIERREPESGKVSAVFSTRAEGALPIRLLTIPLKLAPYPATIVMIR